VTQPALHVPPFDPAAIAPIPRPRILLYSHDGTGLGHLRIVLGLATDLAARRPDASLLLLTGSMQIDSFELPANVDYVKLPAMPKRHLYADLPVPGSEGTPHKQAMYLRNAVARATIEAFQPHLIVVDHAPAGLFRELTDSLTSLHNNLSQAAERSQIVLLMRDITFGPDQTKVIWQKEGVYELLEQVYDRILVYGDRDIFDPILEYRLSPTIAHKMTFCGYLTPPSPSRPAATVRAGLGVGDLPLVAVSVGGGADGAPLLRAYLNGLCRSSPPAVATLVVTGPLLPEEDRREVERLAAGLPQTTLIPFTADWIDIVHAADAVVCMGGYNAMTEAVHARQRAIVVPRLPGPEEQVIRADRFARRGLVTVVPPASLSPERLWAEIDRTLARGTSPGGSLSFNGSSRIVAELAAMLPR
jgi:predicted glycosyltransferase